MRLPYLEGLRGLMAVWVLLIHSLGFTPYNFNGIPTNGKLPVIVFILLSGFVTHILLKKGEDYKTYLKRRALRLFPIYLVTFIISLIMLDFTYEVLKNLFIQNNQNLVRISLVEQAYNSNLLINILSHLTLTHGLFPNNIFPYTYSIMGQSWSLTLEWQFYLFIPIIYKIIQQPIDKRKIIISTLIILIIMGLSKLYISQGSFLPNMLHFFLIGFFSYPLYTKYIEKGSKDLFIFILITAILIAFKNSQLVISLLLWAGILWLQSTNNKYGELLFNNKFSQFIGKISYSVYCVHMIILISLVYLTQILGITTPLLYSAIVIGGGLIITIIISKFTYKFIEEPFIKIGRKK